MAIFPLAPDQIIAQTCPNGVRRGRTVPWPYYPKRNVLQ